MKQLKRLRPGILTTILMHAVITTNTTTSTAVMSIAPNITVPVFKHVIMRGPIDQDDYK